MTKENIYLVFRGVIKHDGLIEEECILVTEDKSIAIECAKEQRHHDLIEPKGNLKHFTEIRTDLQYENEDDELFDYSGYNTVDFE